MKDNIDFYFDFLSPYSYFAWVNIRETLIQINPKPVFMGALFKHFDFKGPGEIPPKRYHELKKCFRYAFKHKIPFTPPKIHPFNPMLITRMASKEASQADQVKVIDKIFKLIWQEGQTLEDPDYIQDKFKDMPLVFERSANREAKLEIKNNTKTATQLNIFGVPSFHIDQEVFWGNDSIEYLLDYLKGNDNFDKELFENRIER